MATVTATVRRFRAHGAGVPLACFVAVGVVLWLVTWQVDARYGALPDSAPSALLTHDRIYDGWIRFDASWYLRIVTGGYSYTPGQQSNIAFFPSYPLMVRGLDVVIGPPTLAAVLATVMAGAAAVCCFWTWCTQRMTRPQALAALGLLLLYPYGWFLYGAAYGDALFLLTVLGAFLLVERDRPVLAGLVGMVATAGRPVGVALTAGLVVRVLEQRGALNGFRGPGGVRGAMGRLRPADLGVLLSLGGLAAWCGYLRLRFDDPLVFTRVQEWWGQPSSPATWFKVDFFSALAGGEDRHYANGLLLQALLVVAALATLPRIWRRLGAGYAAYTAVVLAIPAVGSHDFQGLGRYLLAAFPVFAVLGEVLAARPTVQRFALIGCGTMLVMFTAGFARGYFLT